MLEDEDDGSGDGENMFSFTLQSCEEGRTGENEVN